MPDARDPSTLFFQADHVRRSIIAAYWAAIILALPLWWYTTSIERLSLPIAQVAYQAETHMRIPVRIVVDAGTESASLAPALRREFESRIRESPQRWEALDVHIDHTRHTDDAYTIVPSSTFAIVKVRQLAYPFHTSTTSELMDDLSALLVPFASMTPQDYRVLRYSPRYRLSFSLLHEDAAAGHVFEGWDVADAIYRHISPILSQLSVLHNFTIESQVQFHARLAFSPRSLDHAFGISPEDLSVFVNSAEWTLSSSASNDPVIHFVLFVPSAERRPLHILDNKGSISTSNAFLLPQWGGIVILNPQEAAPQSILASTSLDPVFLAFSNHLLALLGVPEVPRGVEKILDTPNVLTEWQLDALLRYRALTNAQGAKDTLQSIVKLVNQIENMPVGQDVIGDIQGALGSLEQMYDASTKSLIQTLRHSARAFTLSSRAFFNPGMLALLYFPAEHKYAVYTPMFASAVIPLFVAALREASAWRRQRNEPIGNLG